MKLSSFLAAFLATSATAQNVKPWLDLIPECAVGIQSIHHIRPHLSNTKCKHSGSVSSTKHFQCLAVVPRPVALPTTTVGAIATVSFGHSRNAISINARASIRAVRNSEPPQAGRSILISLQLRVTRSATCACFMEYSWRCDRVYLPELQIPSTAGKPI